MTMSVADPAVVQGFDHSRRLLARGDWSAAEALLRQTLARAPDEPALHANLAYALDGAGAVDAAEAAYRRALALAAGSVSLRVPVLVNLAALLLRHARHGEAEAALACALTEDPGHAAAWSNLGVLYAAQGAYEDAEACCRRSLALDPGAARARANLAYLCLRNGRFDEGWPHYEARPWRADLAARVDAPRWAGEPLAGRSLLVVHEGGHGDLIQCCRFLPLLKRRGVGRLALVAPASLLPLLATLDGVDQLLPLDAALPRDGWDAWASALSLPALCGTRPEAIPAVLPYLRSDADRRARWQPRLAADGASRSDALRVGLAWRGNPGFENDDQRSLPALDLLMPLMRRAGVRWFSLQKGRGEDEADRAAAAGWPLTPLGPDLADWGDTAAVVAQLDLVISVDTAVAHLAGALGRPCWLLLPARLPDWRWGVAGDQTPWYPGSMRLFRQAAPGDWAPALRGLAAALDAALAQRRDQGRSTTFSPGCRSAAST